jgi:hypothetical protein
MTDEDDKAPSETTSAPKSRVERYLALLRETRTSRLAGTLTDEREWQLVAETEKLWLELTDDECDEAERRWAEEVRKSK